MFSLNVFAQTPPQHLQRRVQGKPFLEQLYQPLHPVLQPHLMSSITAFGAESARRLTGTYSPFSKFHPFSSIGGRSDSWSGMIYLA